jgi:uncharacterized protein with HEPN domain
VRDDQARLRDILTAVDRIQSETGGGLDAFRDDLKLQVWVLYHLQVVGEACRSLSESFRLRFSNPIWTKAIGLRNILVHHYFEIDHGLVWQVVEGDVPSFRSAVESALKELSEGL